MFANVYTQQQDQANALEYMKRAHEAFHPPNTPLQHSAKLRHFIG
jgi:hypothetical protein